MRTRFAALLLVLAVTLGGCTTNDSGDPQVDAEKAGDVAGQIVEGLGKFLGEVKDKAGDALDWVKSKKQTIVVAEKHSDGHNYHLVTKDGTDYLLQLRKPFLTQAGEDPDKAAYDAISKGQTLTVWAVGDDQRVILDIVG